MKIGLFSRELSTAHSENSEIGCLSYFNNFLYDFTLFVINMHWIMLISLFLPNFTTLTFISFWNPNKAVISNEFFHIAVVDINVNKKIRNKIRCKTTYLAMFHPYSNETKVNLTGVHFVLRGPLAKIHLKHNNSVTCIYFRRGSAKGLY